MKNKYTLSKDNSTVNIQLHHKKLGTLETQIDVDDFPIINQINTTWFIGYRNNHIDGVKTKIQRKGIRKQIWLHRLIMQPNNDKVVDHINGNTLDNKKCNLRVVTVAENSTNLSSISDTKSGHTNIYYENGKYGVRIKNKRYGRYNTVEEALCVRDNAIKQIFPLRER